MTRCLRLPGHQDRPRAEKRAPLWTGGGPRAEVPELRGCSAHGDTKAAALQNVEQAIDLWIDTAREFGDPVPDPRGERLMLA